jgi:hypothetical protein
MQPISAEERAKRLGAVAAILIQLARRRQAEKRQDNDALKVKPEGSLK